MDGRGRGGKNRLETHGELEAVSRWIQVGGDSWGWGGAAGGGGGVDCDGWEG